MNIIQKYEITNRNSGTLSSERKKMKNLYSNRYYSEKDLIIRKTIYLNKYISRLLEYDEYTKKYREIMKF